MQERVWKKKRSVQKGKKGRGYSTKGEEKIFGIAAENPESGYLSPRKKENFREKAKRVAVNKSCQSRVFADLVDRRDGMSEDKAKKRIFYRDLSLYSPEREAAAKGERESRATFGIARKPIERLGGGKRGEKKSSTVRRKNTAQEVLWSSGGGKKTNTRVACGKRGTELWENGCFTGSIEKGNRSRGNAYDTKQFI